jgi:hypothetical protein
LSPADDFEVIQYIARIRRKRRYSLGGVQNASATDSNHNIHATRQSRALARNRNRRFACDTEQGAVRSSGFEGIDARRMASLFAPQHYKRTPPERPRRGG